MLWKKIYYSELYLIQYICVFTSFNLIIVALNISFFLLHVELQKKFILMFVLLRIKIASLNCKMICLPHFFGYLGIFLLIMRLLEKPPLVRSKLIILLVLSFYSSLDFLSLAFSLIPNIN